MTGQPTRVDTCLSGEAGDTASAKPREEAMGNKIAFMGVGAVGGYAGAHMVQAGEDVTFIDPWPAHVETMQRDGLKISHIRDVPSSPSKVRAMHLTDAQQLAKEKPIDIAFVCMKSYDTEWATTLISQYLAPGGYHRLAAELHERGDDRRRRRLGQDGGLHRQLDHRRSVRAGPRAPRRRQERHEAHRVPHRRGAWPRHRPGQGDLPPGRPMPTAPWSPRICGASAGRSW